jgi:endonuclease G
MARRKTSGKRGKNKGVIRRLWGYSKLLLLVAALAAVGGGIWYTQQDEATQRHAQEQVIDALDWLAERDETNRDTDKFLDWVISQIPASQGAVIQVGNIEGADQYTFAGIPVSSRPVKILKNEGYIVGYDETMRNPAWVAYRLIGRQGASTVERPSGFEPDSRTRARVDHNDYTKSGYDRGHMAPNYAIGMSYGEKAQLETFLMSNIVPQLPDLNRGAWKELEQLVANDYLRSYREIWVITGPIYEEPTTRLNSGVTIPSAFFKVLVDVVEPGSVRVLSFVMPQTLAQDAKVSSYLVSVDEIEAATGLDLLSLLDDAVENQLEAVKAIRMW